jgi:predicted RNA binding protein YcfA (HicA-like mRNA interferase family)
VHHIKGSHHSLRHPNKPELRMVVRKDLPLGTIRSIIKQSGLTEEEFLDLV